MKATSGPVRPGWSGYLDYLVLALQRRGRLIYLMLLGLMAVASVINIIPLALDRVRTLHEWTIADWLINYSSGFVRRGLIGEILARFGELAHVRPQYLALGLYVAAFAALAALKFALFSRVRDPTAILGLAFAPFMFLFEFRAGLAAFRKDTLFLLMLAAVAYAFAQRKPGRQSQAVEVALCCLPFLVLSHEMFFLYSPYLLAFAAMDSPSRARWIRLGVLWSVSAAAFALAVVFHGDSATALTICNDLGVRVGSLEFVRRCLSESPVQALGLGVGDSWQIFRDEYAAVTAPTLPLALLMIAIGFVPAAGFLHRMRQVRPAEFRGMAICVAAAILMCLPLFPFAMDWGRFLHLHAVSAGLIVTAALVRAERGEWVGEADQITKYLRWPGYLASVTLYAVAWHINHLGGIVGPGLGGWALSKLF